MTMFLKYLPQFLTVFMWLGLYCFGYYNGCKVTTDKYNKQLTENEIRYTNQIIDLQNALTEISKRNYQSIDNIMYQREKDYLNELEIYQSTISSLDGDILNGLQYHECSSKDTSNNLPPTSTNSEKSICFSRTEFSKKLERDMANAKRCDQLAIDYNSLLSICQTALNNNNSNKD